MKNVSAAFNSWLDEAHDQGRIVKASSHVQIAFTFKRHNKFVEWDVPIQSWQLPEAFCFNASKTWIRGEMKDWVWEVTDEGKTRLWVPTELAIRAVLLGGIISRVFPLGSEIAGANGIKSYQSTESWYVSFVPLSYFERSLSPKYQVSTELTSVAA